VHYSSLYAVHSVHYSSLSMSLQTNAHNCHLIHNCILKTFNSYMFSNLLVHHQTVHYIAVPCTPPDSTLHCSTVHTTRQYIILQYRAHHQTVHYMHTTRQYITLQYRAHHQTAQFCSQHTFRLHSRIPPILPHMQQTKYRLVTVLHNRNLCPA